MRVPWVPLGPLAVLLMLCLPAMGALGEGGVDPQVPSELYNEDRPGPIVEFENATVEMDNTREIVIKLTFLGNVKPTTGTPVEIYLEIYRYAMFGTEEDLDEMTEPVPMFTYDDPDTNDTDQAVSYHTNITDHPTWKDVSVPNEIFVPADGQDGFFRIRIMLEWLPEKETNSVLSIAYSWGHHSPISWEESKLSVANGGFPTKGDYIITEGGVAAVPKYFNTIKEPNKVPDFGDFTTPVIRPGESGTYNFTVTNRYDNSMYDVEVTVEFYMWATIEDSKPIEDLDGPPPLIKSENVPPNVFSLGTLASGESKLVKGTINTKEDTSKGTYFVRHRITFRYGEVEPKERFQMASRGYFTREQWEGFDYTNLYYQLEVAGIVPDSSFSVKDPVPLWPLATLIVLCVLFGALAVVFYLAEEHGDQYPRLKRGLQFWTGRWEQRKRLMQQRMDELRGEDWEKGDEGEEEVDDVDGDDDGT